MPNEQSTRELIQIFQPNLARERQRVYTAQMASGIQQQEHAPFAHYTSAKAALKIISTKRIWMRNAMAMTDYREVQHGFTVLHQWFPDIQGDINRFRGLPFVAAMEEIAPGVMEEAVARFNAAWTNGSLLTGTYITSISEHNPEIENQHGRLSMWRAFGGSGARVAIVFDIPDPSNTPQPLEILFSPVSYPAQHQVPHLLDEIIANIARNHDFLRTFDRHQLMLAILNMFIVFITCLKHEGFREEKEWRAVYYPHLRSSPLVKMRTETLNGVPQRICEIPLDEAVSSDIAHLDFARIFNRLIIGPTAYGVVLRDAFIDALNSVGVANAADKVVISGIPIRT